MAAPVKVTEFEGPRKASDPLLVRTPDGAAYVVVPVGKDRQPAGFFLAAVDVEEA